MLNNVSPALTTWVTGLDGAGAFGSTTGAAGSTVGIKAGSIVGRRAGSIVGKKAGSVVGKRSGGINTGVSGVGSCSSWFICRSHATIKTARTISIMIRIRRDVIKLFTEASLTSPCSTVFWVE
jgi:hypothetical protein